MNTRVYKNLNNGLWSLKQRIEGKWTVVGHCSSCQLINATAVVSETSRLRLAAAGNKEVHAWVIGTLTAVVDFVPFRGRVVNIDTDSYADSMDYEKITYRPFERGEFFSIASNKTWNRAPIVEFSIFGDMFSAV